MITVLGRLWRSALRHGSPGVAPGAPRDVGYAYVGGYPRQPEGLALFPPHRGPPFLLAVAAEPLGADVVAEAVRNASEAVPLLIVYDVERARFISELLAIAALSGDPSRAVPGDARATRYEITADDRVYRRDPSGAREPLPISPPMTDARDRPLAYRPRRRSRLSVVTLAGRRMRIVG